MPHSVKIVMIEDDHGHARLIEKNIRRANISNQIEHFADGSSALEHLFSEKVLSNGPLLILLDLNLPDMSGTDILEKIKADELTAITVHSDGYANDPSANAEAATLMALVGGLKSTDAFVNTIAYTDYSDFRLLNRLANAGSGACVKAGNIAAVYTSLYSSTKVLGSESCASIDRNPAIASGKIAGRARRNCSEPIGCAFCQRNGARRSAGSDSGSTNQP